MPSAKRMEVKMDKCRRCIHEGEDMGCKDCVNFVPFGDHFEKELPEGSISDIY